MAIAGTKTFATIGFFHCILLLGIAPQRRAVDSQQGKPVGIFYIILQ